MQKLLIGILLTQVSLGCLLFTFSFPWWVVLFVALLVWSSTNLELQENTGEWKPNYGSYFFMLLIPCLWITGVGIIVLSVFLLIWHLQTDDTITEIHGVATLCTYLFFFAFRAPDLIIKRVFRSVLKFASSRGISFIQINANPTSDDAANQWVWIIPIVVSALLVLTLSNLASVPVFAFPTLHWRGLETLPTVFDFISHSLNLGSYVVDLADATIAFGITWVASVFYTIPATKQWLLRSLNPLQTSLILLIIASAGLGIGWTFAVQYQTLVAAILAMTLGIYVFCWGIFFVVRDWTFYRSVRHTTGMITNLVKYSNAYFPGFRFVDSTGAEWTVVSEIGFNPCSYKVGDEIEILYNLNANPVAKINSRTSLLLGTLITLLITAIGLFMLGSGIHALFGLFSASIPTDLSKIYL